MEQKFRWLSVEIQSVKEIPPCCGYQRVQAVQLRGDWAELGLDDHQVQSGHSGGVC